MQKRLKLTVAMVVLSLVGSVASFVSIYIMGGTEVYPFYYWKLYSQPAGWELTHSGYRIYAAKEDGEFERLANTGRKTFDRDETLYFLNPTVKSIIENTGKAELDMKRLKVFCEYIAPEYSQYAVVEETFNPLEIIKDSEAYERDTLFFIR